MGQAVPYTAHEVESPFSNLLYKEGCKRIFLQSDPIGFTDSLNLFAYTKNNPINLTDPTGLVCGPGPFGMTPLLDYPGFNNFKNKRGQRPFSENFFGAGSSFTL